MPTKYQSPYGPNPGVSGGDPRGRTQNQSGYQQQRYESQQGPMANAIGYNYGRGSEADYGNYTNMMNQYNNIASGDGSGGGGGGGGASWNPSLIGYNDPFKSYAGFQGFSENGGYSPSDIANMRARGVGGVRSAYANAEREVGRQRSLQGGYSPNAVATQAKMARERGQATADATQNVEAGIASERQKGRLAGLQGMFGVEGQRLGADLDVGKFNANAMMSAAQSNAASSNASSAQNMQNRLGALSGMRSLYGTTPGMSDTFGNQLINSVGQGGTFGLNLYGQDVNAQRLPGAYDQTMGRVNQANDIFNTYAYPWLKNKLNNKNTSGGGGSSEE